MLESIGIKAKEIFYNLSYDELREHEIKCHEGEVCQNDTFAVDTGVFTGRSPKDKYFVNSYPSNEKIAWGNVNRACTKEIFNDNLRRAKEFLNDKSLYVMDVFCGASLASRKKVRFITQIAWQAHFVKNMFIRPSEEELKDFKPDFTIINACKLKNELYKMHDLNSDVFVGFDIENNIGLILGTWYGGEMKKGIFSMMNYWLPLQGKMSMHCSANVGKNNDVCLFFGLSGTGKTTLSTDANRALIGDDEHGWDENGVFNFEGGCYAKCINLSEENEPEIYNAIRRNALLENVVITCSGDVDFCDASKTENTRVSYPIEHIENHQKSLQAGHPSNIIFLCADAFGVLPPVSKLTNKQAMYYFLSGYTAKVAGTERGVKEPIATFSACFGEPFMPLNPTLYAELLGKKIKEHNVNVYLVNTGWSGGGFGVGARMSIKATRACVNAILDGSINNCEFYNFDVFNLATPKELKGVDTKLLYPNKTWENEAEFIKARNKLASMFIENFKRYANSAKEFEDANPKL
ncbi:phosphoenolpyruvate carboxykinase (ATP) [Campylobacter canadensis]|uniref:Phosphoenolpyruvate carboxykinase (ATP) n=2 Tax=Campylobacter canadensis TaxID=449520 RepID=A0ABS7WSN6_9BACT|nr:phosphoenolpyruvate carboxykinase (ATP) [Campylobacter canadensis]MBZ7994737.1 phosphoenolpyruvate carboxykinase (ATP) [Campylobacter canadensis]MBZ7996555.1 phosphoenolpyruvate carboxykinase (ATP) [Campylobacter canadensis]MBZ7998448.1 phosphoenolpyruvate carboxykinase (ATP) [Campylobacter canadensis]MBZ8000163.1 phosphoenolpyruvate carboxykinase (ATP) [Campylobacter canadensis]